MYVVRKKKTGKKMPDWRYTPGPEIEELVARLKNSRSQK
jgi:hypothetical protein